MRNTEGKLYIKRSRPSVKNLSNKCLTAIAPATVASLSVAFVVTVNNLLVTGSMLLTLEALQSSSIYGRGCGP